MKTLTLEQHLKNQAKKKRKILEKKLEKIQLMMDTHKVSKSVAKNMIATGYGTHPRDLVEYKAYRKIILKAKGGN
jgi:hypothetical protein